MIQDMTELDFYQQRVLNAGVFHGTTLIQAHGEIGGSRHVFVKLQSSAKGGLVYPTIGGVIVNPFKGNAKIYAGDLLEYDPGIDGDKGATVKILKTYEVAKAVNATAEVLVKRDGFRHIPFVGDIIMVAPTKIDGTGTGVTVTAVEKTTEDSEDVWKLTLSAAVTAKLGDVMVEATAATASAKPVVTNPNCFAPSDADFIYTPAATTDEFEGARYTYTPCLANADTVLYKSKMSPVPASVLALNTSKVNGWFSL
jgi:hypothetical protein